MRSPFDTTCDIYRGPGSSSPGTFVGTFDCKLVIEDAIETIGLGAPTVPAYLTIADYVPVGGWMFPAFGMDAELGDRIVVPSGGVDEYAVLLTDLIAWHGQTPYYRSYLMFPVPTPIFAGGVEVGGAGTTFHTHDVVGSGGVLLGGSGLGAYLPGGGVLLGGSGLGAYLPGGGVLLGGSGLGAYLPGGGVLLGGAADYPAVWRIYDKFDVSNQTNNGRTPDTINSPGGTWSNSVGTCSIVSNKVIGTSFASFAAKTVIDNGVRASTVKLICNMPSSTVVCTAGIIFRYTDSSNFWRTQISSSTLDPYAINNKIYVVEYLAGTINYLASTSVTTNPLTDLEVTLADDGTNIAANVNGVSHTLSSTSQNGNTKVGIDVYSENASVSPTFDEFRSY